MIHRIRLNRITLAAFAALVLLGFALTAHAQWPQWGGPNRDFTLDNAKLAETWPEAGPPILWKRTLGDGYASIIVDDGRLFTMYRKTPTDTTEYTVALNAKTGKTLWEHGIESSFTENMQQYGGGPCSTPIVVGDRLYSVGAHIVMHCFDKKTGEVLWQRDLAKERKLDIPSYGFACSPIAYKDTIILPVVAQKPRTEWLIALDQKTGKTVWENDTIKRVMADTADYSSPILIQFDGEEQLIFFTNDQLVGLNPATGERLWTHLAPTQAGVNVSTPIWNGVDVLFCAAAYDSGARAVRLRHRGKQTITNELWFSRKMRIHHGNAIRVGDIVYGSSGDFSTPLLVAINLYTGEPVWRKRGFSKANFVKAGDKLIILDEDGQLALTSVSEEGLEIHAKHKVSERLSWTAPTLVDSTLYLRDRVHIMALDLGTQATVASNEQ